MIADHLASGIVVLAVALAVVVAAVPLRPRSGRSEPNTSAAPSRLATINAMLARPQRRRARPSARSVATWCDDISRRVRSGSSLREAVCVHPLDEATARATVSLRLGIDRGLPVADATTRVRDAGPHLALALGVIATTSRIGGPAAASIDRTAMLLRQRATDRDERSTQAAQARLSTHVMTAVPLLMLATLVATDRDVRSVVASPIGITCVGVGLVLNGLGWWWMRRIVSSPP
jgi:Flp pilus assembly protein TadB